MGVEVDEIALRAFEPRFEFLLVTSLLGVVVTTVSGDLTSIREKCYGTESIVL